MRRFVCILALVFMLYGIGASNAIPQVIRVPDAGDILGWYNVRAYGAKGDGVTDDRPAFQAALDAASAANGGVVYGPPGQYLLAVPSGSSQALAIKSHRITLRGAGPSTQLRCGGPGGAGAATVYVGNPATPGISVDHCRIVDLHFNPTVAKNRFAGGVSGSPLNYTLTAFEIKCPATTGLVIEGCTFGRPQDMQTNIASPAQESNVAGCIDLGGNGAAQCIRIRNLQVFGACHTVRLAAVIDVWIQQVLADANQVNAVHLLTTGLCEAVIVSDSDFVNSKSGGYPNFWLADSYANFNKFTSVYFDTAQIGVQIDGGSDNRFTSCWFSDRPGQGAVINGGQNNSFVNCDFTNGGAEGITINGTATGTIVSNCSFGATGVSTPADGIVVGATTSETIITGNHFRSADYGFLGVAASILHGVTIKAGATNVVCDGNITVGCGTPGINAVAPVAASVKIGTLNIP